MAATRFAPGHFKFQAKEERGNLAPNWDWTADEDYFLTMYVGEGAIITIEMEGACAVCCVVCVLATSQLLPFIIAHRRTKE